MTKNSLSTKIILMVEIILLVFSTLFCTVSIYRARVGIRKAIQQRMLDIANCASGSVSGDIIKNFTEDTVGSKEYNDVYNTLAVFRDNVELEYVYSIKEESEGNFIFTMDLDQYTPASYGDPVEYTEALASAGRGIAAVDEVPYTDQWGEFYSAYSPVFDSTGKVAGIVAVDFAVDWFEDQLSSQTRSTILSYIVILAISLSVGAVLALLTVRPYVRSQGELLEEKVRAESANHAKSDFLANMSHEIRTPINAVLGMNEMILREGRQALDKKNYDRDAAKDALRNIGVYAADIENAGHNLLALVNDILDFSKIEAGRMDLVEAPYRLSSLLNNVSSMILFKAKDKGLDFVIDVDESLPDELCGDEMRVKQVLTNILNNAVKYTEEGCVRLTLKGEKTNGDTLILKAEVEDTGIGIREEDIQKLFKQFERLEMERNSTVEGTGLGLAITKRLLDMMNGEISVESEYKKGSVFKITIPQKIVSEAALGDFEERFKTNITEGKKYKESFRAPDARILIVDDTKINLTVASNLLKNTGIQIDTAGGGEEAVKKAKENYYDLILMDQRMPVMDGTEALHNIRANETDKSNRVPVICLTADAVIGARERYLAEGFSDYLTKPIDSYELEKMLINYLPVSKVMLVEEEKDEAPQKEELKKDAFDILREAGIETWSGLQYCQNDEAFYRSLLEEYANVWIEKSEHMQKNFEAKNWHDYAIYVHSLKSTSKMIGADKLSEISARLETAATASDSDTIERLHEDMMNDYKKAVSAIDTLISSGEDKNNAHGGFKMLADDGGIMEFLPEDNR